MSGDFLQPLADELYLWLQVFQMLRVMFDFLFLETQIEQYSFTLIENDHLGDWSPENGCCWRLAFRQPVPKPSSECLDCGSFERNIESN